MVLYFMQDCLEKKKKTSSKMWERHWYIALSWCKGGRKGVPGVYEEIAVDGTGWKRRWVGQRLQPNSLKSHRSGPTTQCGQPDLNLVPGCGLLNNPTWELLQLLSGWKMKQVFPNIRFILSIRKSSLLLSVPFRRDFRVLKKYFYKCRLAWL